MIIIDVETTGLNPWKHSILSLAALQFSDPSKTFYKECKLEPDAIITQQALDVNGFTREQIFDQNKPSTKEIIQEFLEWAPTQDRILAGHDPAFDKYCILHVCEKNNLTWPFEHRVVDLHTICYAHFAEHHPELLHPDPILKLDFILEHVGLPKRVGNHNALDDVKLEAESLSRLMYKKGLLPEFSKYPLET